MASLISICAAFVACKPTKRTVGEQGSFVRGYDMVATKRLSEVLAISDLMRSACSGVKIRYGSWIGTGMYTLSDSHPCGVVSNDKKVAAAECRANNIPTV
jgi:hypothetical protein